MKYQLLRLIGFNPIITRRMDGASTGTLLLGFVTILFVATVSAALFAATFSRLCFGGDHYWVLFSIWFALIWLLDSVVLRSLGSNVVIGIRIAIVVVIALLNSLTFDELLFHRDLSNFLNREYQAKVEQVENNAFSVEYARIRAERKALSERGIQLRGEVEDSRRRVLKEWLGEAKSGVEGQGWRYGAKLATHQTDSVIKYAELGSIQDRIGRLDSAVNALDGKKQARIQAMVKPEDSGLRDNVNALHRLVFGPEGKPMDKLYFLLLFGLGVILEALVLIIKPGVKGAVADYHKIAIEQAKAATDRAIKKIKDDGLIRNHSDTLSQREAMNDLSTRTAKVDMDHRAAMAVDEIEGKIRKAVLEEEAIHEAVLEAQRRNDAMRTTMGGLYEDFGRELHNRALTVIRNEIDRLAAKSRRATTDTKEPA